MASVLLEPPAGARIPFKLRVARVALAAVVYALWAVLRLLPLDAASAFTGGVARAIGPRLGLTRRARRELARAFPAMPAAEVEAAVREMWENIGRMVGEFAHLDRLNTEGPDARIELVGKEHVDDVKRSGRPSLFFAGHFGNWELGALVGRLQGLEVTLLYRAANNPYLESLIQRCRRPVGGSMLPKGHRAARGITDAMRRGGVLGMLVDQKTNNGIEATFFGRPAMTTQVPAVCALNYDCLLIPVQVERLQGARFRVTVHPPLPVQPTDDRAADMRSVTEAINAVVEAWVRHRPAQWMWLHRRWAD